MAITDGLDLIDGASYAEKGAPHDLWTRLRAESPVHWCTPAGFLPFWAITRHADICELSTRPLEFSSTKGIALLRKSQSDVLRKGGEGFGAMRVIIEMDPPEHHRYRKVASPVFTPRAVKAFDGVFARSAREVVDRLAAAGPTGEGECDFADDVAVAHSLRILCTILGVPRDTEADILRLTNEFFALEDPDLQRPGVDRKQALIQTGMELYQIFNAIIEDRRSNPRDDIASVIANGIVDGEPMGLMETLGYFLITFSAGHDTTKGALVGGMRALLEHPEQLAWLREHPDRVDAAVEEIARWTTPVNYMMRCATTDYELGGQTIREGDRVLLFYASANRDEELFDDPFAFRLDRDPNPHLAFGVGEHYCLGANLARRSIRALLLELAPRLEWAELAGEPEFVASSFFNSLKKLPMRYRITPPRRPEGDLRRCRMVL